MTDNLWTKGPWHVGDEDEDFDEVEYIEVHAGEYSTETFRAVAHIQAGFNGSHHVALAAEDRANAHMIASAPELADGLAHYADQLCEGWCEGAAEFARYDDCGGCLAMRLCAKARGEQS